jgi:hypothetical protein
MWKAMKKATILDMIDFKHYISITTTRRSCNDVLIKGKGNEEDERQKVHDSANSSHRLRSGKSVSMTTSYSPG